MEQDRKPTNKPTHLWSISLEDATLYNGEKTVSIINGSGETGQLHVKKNETRTFFNTIHKNKLKMD